MRRRRTVVAVLLLLPHHAPAFGPLRATAPRRRVTAPRRRVTAPRSEPTATRRQPGPLRATTAESFVSERAPALLVDIVKHRTELGTTMKRQNARTGGSAVVEDVTLDALDAWGLRLTCNVKRRLGFGMGRGFETTQEPANATWAELMPGEAPGAAGAALDGATAQRRFMQIACGLGLAGDAARLLDASFPGGFGDAGRLPDDMWLNNIPASPLARQHMADASIRAILDALADPAAPPTLALTVKPPELDPEMDTYRIGTLLELVRAIAFRVIDETGKRVRICVQGPMGEGIFAGLPLSLNGVRKLLQLMDWGSQGEELMADDYVRFGAVGAADVDEKDDVFIILAPQSIVGNSIVPLLEEMVEAAAGRPIITINGRLDDVQSAAGVMSYRGRGDRLDFVDAWKEIFHFSLIVPTGRTFYPILGAVCMPLLGAPYALYQRLELCTEKDRRFANSVERAAAARAGELSETYRPIGCFAEFPTGKEQKLAFREAAKLVMEGIY